MQGDDVVGAEEILYRRVRVDWAAYKDGQWRITSEAFNDSHKKPSVNRKKLRDDPAEAKLDATDGVLKLVAAQIREVSGIVQNTNAPKGAPKTYYKLDVFPRPILKGNPDGLPENPAHAQVESDPTVESRSRFDKVKEALGRIAMGHGWLIEPTTPPTETE